MTLLDKLHDLLNTVQSDELDHEIIELRSQIVRNSLQLMYSLFLLFFARRFLLARRLTLLLLFYHFGTLLYVLNGDACLFDQVSEDECVGLDVVIIIILIVQELLELPAMLLCFDDVADLGEQNLLNTCFETVHGLVEVFRQLELSLADRQHLV